jgi:hypothetical protein
VALNQVILVLPPVLPALVLPAQLQEAHPPLAPPSTAVLPAVHSL